MQLNQWRVLLLAFLAIAALAAFAACGDDDETGGGTATPAGDNLAADQTLRIHSVGEPQTLDPQQTGFDVDISIIKQLWRGLLYFDGPDLNLVPAVAEEIPTTENGGISEMGTHAELLRQRGHYYQLYTRQFRRALESEYGLGKMTGFVQTAEA